ncbi:MAG: flagellar hook-associated protein 2 [Thiomicrorhabdus sp.]|nr:MAG: flagellar hook-associated protein 2 [Thiomicrorhabdus sp.]
MSTTSDIGTTLLSSLTNSTFDIKNLAKVSADAEVAGPKAIIDRGVTKATTELDALKYLETNLSAFQTYVTDLASPDIFSQKTGVSTDESVVLITAEDSAAVGTYQIESRQLAQSHTQVANKGYTSTADLISAGTLNIAEGGVTHAITVDSSNNTLDGLQQVINSGDYGVSASIINNGGSYQLMFTSKESGAAGEVSISGLADFDTDGLTTTAEAQDAVMTLNGLTVTSSSNTFDNVIEGLSFKLNSTDIGTAKMVSIGQDEEGVIDTVSSFVEVYNQLHNILGELGSYDSSDLTEEELDSEEYQYYGDLAGSSLLRSIESQIRDSMSGAINELNGSITSLSMAGISVDREGALVLDSEILSNVASTDMQALSNLFSKGGISDDALINVLTGSEKTITGNYALDVTQLAERATVSGGAVTYAANEYRVSGDRVTDATSVLNVDVGAQFDLDINGTVQTISLTDGAYVDKDTLATHIQDQINASFGAGAASVAYDISQSRFEFTTAGGVMSMSNSVNLESQGFSGTNYAGKQLIDLSAADATFNILLDTSTTSLVTIQADKYTLEELATKVAGNINSNTDMQSAGATVSVSTDGGVLNLFSDRFGGFSKVELTNVAGFANGGFSADLIDAGQSVDGTITTASGILNIGAYTDSADGRLVNISDFAMISGNEAEVRGLSFEVLGGIIGARGNITFAQGFASRIDETINNLFEEDYGLVSSRMDSLNTKLESYVEQTDKLDLRYERLELKYRMEFSMLQSLMSSSEATRDQLSAQFGNRE